MSLFAGKPTLFHEDDLARMRERWPKLKEEPTWGNEDDPTLEDFLDEVRTNASYGGEVFSEFPRDAAAPVVALSTRTWVNERNRDFCIYQLAPQVFVAATEDDRMYAYARPHVAAVVSEMNAAGYFSALVEDGEVPEGAHVADSYRLPAAKAFASFGLDPLLAEPLFTPAEKEDMRQLWQVIEKSAEKNVAMPDLEKFLSDLGEAAIAGDEVRISEYLIEKLEIAPTLVADYNPGDTVHQIGEHAFIAVCDGETPAVFLRRNAAEVVRDMAGRGALVSDQGCHRLTVEEALAAFDVPAEQVASLVDPAFRAVADTQARLLSVVTMQGKDIPLLAIDIPQPVCALLAVAGNEIPWLKANPAELYAMAVNHGRNWPALAQELTDHATQSGPGFRPVAALAVVNAARSVRALSAGQLTPEAEQAYADIKARLEEREAPIEEEPASASM